jgi:hypothetical protein
VPSEARKRGSGAGSPRKYDDLLTGPSDQSNQLIDQLRSGDQAVPVNSVPSEARKRGSGGGSPRKYDDLLTGAKARAKGGSGGCARQEKTCEIPRMLPSITLESHHTKARAKRATGDLGG